MLAGVYLANRKDGSIYYRSNITYKNKHISLGSYPTEEEAHCAYVKAETILYEEWVFDEFLDWKALLPLGYDKIVTLFNFRDRGMYIGTPIYMRNNYFSYFLSPNEELKFDVDDLFYYSTHRIMRRQGHLYVNDYGMQVTILGRYGVRNHGVKDRDYYFANGDETDLRYSNVVVVNRYYGVSKFMRRGMDRYRVKIHINGNYTIGTYSTEEKAAVAYNKAVDLARKAGLDRNYPENYVETLSPKEYAELYTKVKISQKYLEYLGLV